MTWLTKLFRPAAVPPPAPPSLPEILAALHRDDLAAVLGTVAARLPPAYLVEALGQCNEFVGFVAWRHSVEPGTGDETWAWASTGMGRASLVAQLESALQDVVAHVPGGELR